MRRVPGRYRIDADEPETSGRFAVCRRRVLPLYHLPHRLPVQAAEGQLHDEDLPPEHQRERVDLSGHLAGPVEPCADDLQGVVVDLLDVDGSQPGRPARAGYCAFVQDGPGALRSHCSGVDTEVSSLFPVTLLVELTFAVGMPCNSVRSFRDIDDERVWLYDVLPV